MLGPRWDPQCLNSSPSLPANAPLGSNLHCLLFKTPHFVFVMKLSGLLTLLPLLLSTSVAYASGTRDVFQARQAHVKKSLVDVCAALDVDVNLNLIGT